MSAFCGRCGGMSVEHVITVRKWASVSKLANAALLPGFTQHSSEFMDIGSGRYENLLIKLAQRIFIRSGFWLSYFWGLFLQVFSILINRISTKRSRTVRTWRIQVIWAIFCLIRRRCIAYLGRVFILRLLCDIVELLMLTQARGCFRARSCSLRVLLCWHDGFVGAHHGVLASWLLSRLRVFRGHLESATKMLLFTATRIITLL